MTTLQELLSDSASTGTWTLAPERSTIAFTAKSLWGLMPVKGRFKEFSGSGEITSAGTISGRLDIKVASLDTKIGKRDNHLRSADFFDVDKYPDITVVVTGAEPTGGDTVELRADLTVKDTTATVPLVATVTALDDGGVQITTRADVNRSDFGVGGTMAGMIRDQTAVTADVVFRRTGA
ncbi:hypothetical protein CQY20_24235 [Mycolicibacterium agri]|uniref:Lipid/polyisoprenoid-binding YceI-like domain-containing protein n=1 Tax=Mycolicibacterium agri TaxID=36811 RepID=A0A2A7MSN1_MYCAG|nr:YceI family protein [Mycolicibacterium agri]PEG34725.1 hypothetical protein CQY20_24235 [Mycolicibacterium agri]GFG50454.1 hypothetical protein MAGR_18950 [Mycolicibacterium agri]